MPGIKSRKFTIRNELLVLSSYRWRSDFLHGKGLFCCCCFNCCNPGH